MDALPDDDESAEVPPAADRVAARALVLSAIVCRSAIERDAGNPEAEQFRQEVRNWFGAAGLTDETEPDELKLLDCPLGTLDDRQRIDASWRGEGLCVLAWALGLAELPTYDVMADPHPSALALGFREVAGHTALKAPKLRPSDEIRALADTYFTLHWRLRQYSMDRKPMDFSEFARTAWFGPLPLTGVRLMSRDLEVRGMPLSDSPEATWREVLSIVRERQQAANWLLGQEPTYSQVTCDT